MDLASIDHGSDSFGQNSPAWRQSLIRWMAANVAVAQDPAGNLKPAKDKSTERIDGIVATIMAIGRAMVAQEEPKPEYSMFFVDGSGFLRRLVEGLVAKGSPALKSQHCAF
jgi:Phage Terminase